MRSASASCSFPPLALLALFTFAKMRLSGHRQCEAHRRGAGRHRLDHGPTTASRTRNFASISATGIAIDGVPVYPTLNNALNVSASEGELSSIGIHSGRGLGVHYHADAYSATHSGFNLYNAADYEGYSHPPIISLGFDGVAGYGRYMAGDTTSDGIETLDDWSGHEHGIYGYHDHSETAEQTAEVNGPDAGSVS